MTNKTDNYYSRIEKLGQGLEETEGVTKDGFADPNGEFPDRDYFYANSINKSAKGEVVNNLSVGGGDYGVNLTLPEQKPSIYPYNQVQETSSGHSFEMDDTPGGERVLIKHRTGAGIELRADGTVVISSRNQRVEVTGGDHTTIVEGEGTLVYKGNVNLSIDGDFNVDVRGNYNVNVGGDKKEEIKGRHSKTVNRDQNYTIRGARSEQVIGMATTTVLDDYNINTKGNQKLYTEGNTEILTGGNLITTAVNEWVAASATANITARHVSMIGEKGTIGGALMNYYGQFYGGLPGGTSNICAFHGTLVGKAAEAIVASSANVAGYAISAAFAKTAGKAATGTPVPFPPVTFPMVMPFTPLPSTSAYPNPALIEMQLQTDEYGIRNVGISGDLKDKLKKIDDYEGQFTFDPSIHEIRAILRGSGINQNKLTGHLTSTGKLNKQFKKNIPRNIGRTAAKKGTVRFGSNILGNNAAENRSKRFKVNTK